MILFGMVQKLYKKKILISPQWLRNIKGKKYPKWRIRYFYFQKKNIIILFLLKMEVGILLV